MSKATETARAEEEAYRTKIREQLVSENKTGYSSFPWWLLIIPVVFIILVGTLFAINPAKKFEQTKKTQTSQESKQGTFYALDKSIYNYDIIHDTDKDNYSVTFSPSLPGDNNTLFLALQKVFETAYEDDAADIPAKPTVEEKDGVSVLKFSSPYSNYYVLPIKGNAGEIQSLTLWKE